MKRKAEEVQAVMIANLMDSVEMEGHLQLCYHMEHRYWKFRKFPLNKKFGEFGEEIEEWQEEFFKQLFRLGKSVQYDAGTITSQEPSAAPSEALVQCLGVLLGMEQEISTKYEDYCIQAWEARDDEVRNWYEHAIKYHHVHEEWLNQKIEWAKDLGAKDFAASELAQS